MKAKNMIFVLGAALTISFGVFSNAKDTLRVNAEEITDLGTISFSGANSDSVVTNIYGINLTPNDAPADGWNSEAFHPTNDNSGTFINDERVGAEIKKLRSDTYYIAVTNATVGSVATVKGEWANSKFKFTLKPFSVKWTGSKWENSPILDAYDTFTLIDTCFEDKDRVSFDTTGVEPCVWNSFETSSENTRKSFALKFVYENYEKKDANFGIKICNNKYDSGHYYHLFINNAWGPHGDIFLREMVDGSVVEGTDSGEIRVDLEPGARHTIEFGSIYIKDSTDTYNYVKYDGEVVYSLIKEPASHVRTTRVSYYFSSNTIFVGSTPREEKENTQILQVNKLADNKKGIFLNGALNDIPSGWDVKGAPIKRNNILYNGEPMFAYGTSDYPIVKCGSNEIDAYYLNLDLSGKTLKEGDVITLSDEFHFFKDGKVYSMAVIPVSFEFSKNQLNQIGNIKTYLYNKIETHCDPDYYDDDKVTLINSIVEDASEAISDPALTNMKALWDLYYSYIAELDEVPISEEKAAEILKNAKIEAKAALDALLDPTKYDETHYASVENIVQEAKAAIDSTETNTVAKVEEIVNGAIEEISEIPTKQQVIEAAIMSATKVSDIEQYLTNYEVVTTTDLCATGYMSFEEENAYHSGGYDDISTRIAVSDENVNGNMIFQFKYQSDDPSSRALDPHGNLFSAQIFIRMRGTDSTAYRFDIATPIDGTDDTGIAMNTFVDDHSTARYAYNAELEKDTPYVIGCGAIDLAEYNRTFLFMTMGEGEQKQIVTKAIVDSLDNTRPTIAIRDSYAGGTNVATLTPVETGTTKDQHASLIGLLDLNSSSNKSSLIIESSLKGIDIASGTELYPVKAGSLTINDQEVAMDDVHPSVKISKLDNNQYKIDVSKCNITNGDRVHVGGYFASFDGFDKSIYRIFDTTYTYNEQGDSWTQSAPTDQDLVSQAKETIRRYANLADYSEAAQQTIQGYIDQYVAEVDAVTEDYQTAVPQIVAEALNKIDSVKTILDEYKDAAIEELNNYRSPDLYRDEEKAELARVLASAAEQIRNADKESTVDAIVLTTKSQINEIKTADQRAYEELLEARKNARTRVETLSSYIELERYSDANAGVLEDMIDNALYNISVSTSIENIESIVSELIESVKSVPTKDGSKFDGEKYIPKPKSGCGGSVETVSILSFVALFSALALIVIKKKKEN